MKQLFVVMLMVCGLVFAQELPKLDFFGDVIKLVTKNVKSIIEEYGVTGDNARISGIKPMGPPIIDPIPPVIFR